MLKEVIESLEIKESGIYVDLTFGGGGHSKKILKNLGKYGKLYAFDQDSDTEQNKIFDNRLIFINQNFKFLKQNLNYYNCDFVDGVLADLGVSSYQIDTPERGFSTRFDSKLELLNATGLEIDLTVAGLGTRLSRFAIFVDNGLIKNIFDEEGGGLEKSSAENLLKNL